MNTVRVTNQEKPSIYLRSISLDDVNTTYVDWLNDPQVNQYLETRFSHQNIQSVRSFVKTMIKAPNEHLFTIRTCDDQHIGNIKIGAINMHHGYGEVSLFIGDKNAWGKGYATLAIELISYYALSALKLRKLSAGAYQANIASTKAFIKAGYEMDGIKKGHFRSHDEVVDGIYVCLFSDQVKIPNSLMVEELEVTTDS